MSAFSQALAALHADPNLSVACEWAPAWDRPYPRTLTINLLSGVATLAVETVVVRGVRGQEIAPAFGVAGSGSVAGRQAIDISIADLPLPARRNDILRIDAATYRVESPERDLEALTWRIPLAEG